MNKIRLSVVLFLFISTFLNAQIHMNGDRYLSDTIYVNKSVRNIFYLVSLEVRFDSLVSNGEINKIFYSYNFDIRYHDSNLITIDSNLLYKRNIEFIMRDNLVYFCSDAIDSNINVNLKSNRADSNSFIIPCSNIYYGIFGSKMIVKYLPKVDSYSSADVLFENSWFIKMLRFEYGIGISLIEFNSVGFCGPVTLYKKHF